MFEKLDKFINEFSYPVIICIAGPSCSGKTYLSKMLNSKYPQSTIIHQDDWYKNMCDIPRNNAGYPNMESISAFHTDEMIKDLLNLLCTGTFEKPIYDISSNERIDKQKQEVNNKIIIIDGLHSIELILNKFPFISTYYIYVNTDINECIKRRVERDSKLFGIPQEKISNHYKNVIWPNYQIHAETQEKYVTNNDRGEVI